MAKKTVQRKKKKKNTVRPVVDMSRSLEGLVEGLLSKTSLETVIVPINLRVPKALYETYKAVAKEYNLPLEEALQNLANTGIQKALQDSVSFNKPSKIEGFDELAAKNGIDLSPVTESLSKLSTLVGALKTFQKEFDDKTRDIGTSEPDPS